MNPTENIDRLIAELHDWRGVLFAELRKTVLGAADGISEEWKWMGSPVWSHTGILAVANAHKHVVKITFMHGARLADPQGVFNASLEGNARRAIDFAEGDVINVRALQQIVRSAIEFNMTKAAKKSTKVGPKSAKSAHKATATAQKTTTATQKTTKAAQKTTQAAQKTTRAAEKSAGAKLKKKPADA